MPRDMVKYREYQRNWSNVKRATSAGKASARAASAKYRAGYRERLAALKSGPCTDCGVSYPPCVMDFDHVRGEKTKSVGKLATHSMEKILAEIAKCELVCANCHRLRTQARLEKRADG